MNSDFAHATADSGNVSQSFRQPLDRDRDPTRPLAIAQLALPLQEGLGRFDPRHVSDIIDNSRTVK